MLEHFLVIDELASYAGRPSTPHAFNLTCAKALIVESPKMVNKIILNMDFIYFVILWVEILPKIQRVFFSLIFFLQRRFPYCKV